MKKEDTKKIRHMPYIIRAKGNVSRWIRVRDLILTIVLWAIYLYLLRDFYIFLGDIYHWLHDDFGPAKAYPKLRIFHTLEVYIRSLIVLTTIFLGWALYNRIRFGHKKRRKATEPVTVNDLGTMFDVEPKDLKGWQKARSLVVTHDKNGRISEVETVQ